MLRDIITQLHHVDRSLKKLTALEQRVQHIIALCEEAILSVSKKSVINHKNYKAEIQLCIAAIFRESESDGGRKVVEFYQKMLELRGNIERAKKRAVANRADIIEHVVIRRVDGVKVTAMSYSKDGKKTQVSLVHNGQPMTRHLTLKDGAWWGKPINALASINQFVRYDIIRQEEEETESV